MSAANPHILIVVNHISSGNIIISLIQNAWLILLCHSIILNFHWHEHVYYFFFFFWFLNYLKNVVMSFEQCFHNQLDRPVQLIRTRIGDWFGPIQHISKIEKTKNQSQYNGWCKIGKYLLKNCWKSIIYIEYINHTWLQDRKQNIDRIVIDYIPSKI